MFGAIAGGIASALSGGVFFFQAEDGIRAKLVTGVQTCALPIFTGCAFSPRSERGRGAPCASGKSVWRWPPVVAADAGLMQIQLWEETVLRCAEAAPWSMTRHSADRENGYGETVM